MKKFLVVGNPIKHTHSPKLHNFWFKKYNINAKYEQRLVDEKNLEEIIKEVREKKIDGINITAPFKQNFFNLVDLKTDEVEKTKSINTVYINEKGLLVEEWRTQSGITYLNIKIKYDFNEKIVELIETRGGYTDIYTYERTSLDTLKIHYYENSVNQLNYEYSQVFIGQENQPDSSYTINGGFSGGNQYIQKDGNLISWTKDGATSFFEYDNFKNPFLGTFSTPGIGSEIHTGQIGLLLSTNNRIKTTRSESVITFTCKYENDFPFQFYIGEELVGEFEFY